MYYGRRTVKLQLIDLMLTSGQDATDSLATPLIPGSYQLHVRPALVLLVDRHGMADLLVKPAA